MKNIINKFAHKFGFEIHGVGYMEKLRNSNPDKNAYLIQSELLNGDAKIIFDVGANRGNTALEYRHYFPNSIIHSFEPFPDSYKEFESLHNRDNKIILSKCALSSEEGTAILNINKSVDTNSILQSKKLGATSDKSCESIGEIEIPTMTLDKYCQNNNISKIDILKIDVQGFEIEVLKGSFELLMKRDIGLIYLETYFKQQYVDQPLFQQIAQLLYEYNYTLQDIYDPYYASNCLAWCDSIFVKR